MKVLNRIQKYIRILNIHFEKRYSSSPILINIWYDLIKSWFCRLRYQFLSDQSNIKNIDINQKNILVFLYFIRKSKDTSSVEIDRFLKNPNIISLNLKIAELHEIFNSVYWKNNIDNQVDYQKNSQYHLQNKLLFELCYEICEEMQNIRLQEDEPYLSHYFIKSVTENIIGDIFFFHSNHKEYSPGGNSNRNEFMILQISAALNMI